MRVYTFSPLADICKLNMELESANVKFNCYVHPTLYEPDNGAIIHDQDRYATITFRDTYEIDSLIKMLERFRYESCQYIGRWK